MGGAGAAGVWAADKYYGVLDFARNEKQQQRKSKNPVVPYKTSKSKKKERVLAETRSKRRSKGLVSTKRDIENLCSEALCRSSCGRLHGTF